jgi:uncharacterized protein (TIGR02001 family)
VLLSLEAGRPPIIHLKERLMSLKHIAAGLALAFSSASYAGVTANVGAFSEYMFRGVEQSNGAAVQGGVDWASDIGVYVGTWVSNTDYAGYNGNTVSYETDVYGGWTKKWGDFGVDVGGLFYYYRDDARLNTFEIYAAALLGPATLKVYQTIGGYFGARDAGDDDEEGTYLTANYVLALNKKADLTVTPSLGYSFGDGPRDFVVAAFDATPDDSYLDWSVTLAKTVEGFTFSLAVIGTDLQNDREKIVVGLKKTFEL